jgi:hypothetical protein
MLHVTLRVDPDHSAKLLNDAVKVSVTGRPSIRIPVVKVMRQSQNSRLGDRELAPGDPLVGVSGLDARYSVLYYFDVDLGVRDGGGFVVELPDIDVMGRAYAIGPITYNWKSGVQVAGLCQ